MEENVVKKIEKILEVKFSNKDFLQKAFIHKSISKLSNANNERLEFVGDRVLGLTLSNELLKLYPNDTEGDLDKKLASLVNKQACAEVIEDYKLGKFLVLSSSQKKNKVGHKKIYGDLCESLIGAVFIDQGYDVANKFVLRLWKKKLKKSENINIDAKTKLQEYSLKKYKTLPIYKNLSNDGPSHKPIFKVSVKITDSKVFIGEGLSKKKAEQSAALQLISSIKI